MSIWRPRSKGKDMLPEKYAVAAAISSPTGAMLFGLRSDKVSEYRNTWSLPSCVVTRDEFLALCSTKELNSSAKKTLSDKCFEADLDQKLILVQTVVRQRRGYTLHLALVAGDLDFLPRPSSKYSRLDWLSLHDALDRLEYQVGTCVALLTRTMIERGELDYSLQFIEVPPDIADSKRPIEDYSPSELWAREAFSYATLRSQGFESDAEYIRDLTLERFLDRYFSSRKPLRVLDVGCGQGDLVAKLKKAGHDASGIDLQPDPLKKHPDLDLRVGDIDRLTESFPDQKYDLVVLNMVVQWIEDLEHVASQIMAILDVGGCVLISLVPPEHAKNGEWELRDGQFQRLTTAPLRRGQFLSMIGHSVGPLWYFPRTIPEYIHIFGKCGLPCSDATYIFIDSFLSPKELEDVLREHPELTRHQLIPTFLTMEFRKATQT